jgi:3D (Asp-Asp-Asp) domain-containing protein
MVYTYRKLLVLLILSLYLMLGLKIDLQSHAIYAGGVSSDQPALLGYTFNTPMAPKWKPDAHTEKPTIAEPVTAPVIEQVAKPAAAEVEQPSVPQPLFYWVNPGDTIYNISEKFGVSADSLIAENLIKDPHLLAIGQQLQIPAAEAAIPLPDGQHKIIKQVISSTLTAYTAGLESTGKTADHADYGITFSGSKAAEGRTIAVDPAVIPIGSQVFIDGIGIRTAEDTGSAVRGARIDVFMDDLGQALEFGVKRNVKVYVLSADNV